MKIQPKVIIFLLIGAMLSFILIKLNTIHHNIRYLANDTSYQIFKTIGRYIKSQWQEYGTLIILFFLIVLLIRETLLTSQVNFNLSKYLEKLNLVLISQSQNRFFYDGNLIEGAKSLTKEVSEVSEIDRTSIWLYDDDLCKLECQQLYINSSNTWHTGIEVKVSDYPELFTLINTGHNIIVNDLDKSTDPNINTVIQDYYIKLGIKAILIVPVIYAGTTVGILSNSDFKPRVWTENEITFMQLIASLFAFAYSIKLSNESELELERKNVYLEHAAKIIRHDLHSGINTYIPRGVSALERRLDNKTITDLKLEIPIKIIKEGLKHAQKVYRGVYEFTNLVKKNQIIDKKEYDLAKILKDYLESTTYYNDQVLITDLGRAEVNEPLFCTAIDNLIRNGLKYNDSPSKLVRIYREDNNILVEDNGRGMSSGDFELLSKPYIRKANQHESGSGLGLNICVAILHEHDFLITCEKLTPIGTRIKINIKKNITK